MSLFGGLLACGIGATFFFIACRQILFAFRAKRWPTTTGKITASDVWSNPGADSTKYRVSIGYEYVVGGHTFIGTEVRIGLNNASTGSRRAAQRLCRKYPVGSRVAVHYNPNDPRRSLVETGISIPVVLNSLVAITFTATGIIVIVATLRPM
jgi:uncharacterized protein DUF3592